MILCMKTSIHALDELYNFSCDVDNLRHINNR